MIKQLAAKLMEVDVDLVRRADRIKQASPDVFEKVKVGDITIGEAEALLRPPKTKPKREAKKIRGVYECPVGSGVWWVQHFDVDGRRRREKVGPKSMAVELAEKRRSQKRAGVKLPERLRARPVMFRGLADAALEYSKANKRSYQNDRYRMAPLVVQFGDRQAESILPEEFEKWLEGQAEARKWSPATKNRYIALFKLTYRLAERDRKVKINPARLLRMPKENNSRIRYLNQYKPKPTGIDYLKACPEEESRLRAVIAREYLHHLPEFEIALGTGMRRSEMYAATWPNVDFEHHVLTVPRSKHGETRQVQLNSSVLAILDFLRTRAGDSKHVFLSMRNNDPLTANRHWFEDAVKKAGIEHFTWHDLRHTFGSRLAMRGVDLRKIQDLMGHKTISVTLRYVHISQPDLLAEVEKLVSAPSATKGATSEQRQPETKSATAGYTV
jgi:site-specific recombinase XerD